MTTNQTQLKPEQMSPNPPINCPFNVGDIVTYTNDYGVPFEDRKVVGFTLPGNELLNGGCVYLEKDAYWFPVPVASLKRQPLKETSAEIGERNRAIMFGRDGEAFPDSATWSRIVD